MWQVAANATKRYCFNSAGILLKFTFQNTFLAKQVGEINSQNMYLWDTKPCIILFYIPFLFCAIQRLL